MNTALIYLSDHGESLGESGIYLHGTPYMLAPEQQTHIPFMFWLSPDYAKNFGSTAVPARLCSKKCGFAG